MGRSPLLATCILFASLSLGGAACTNDDGAILILQNQVADSGCIVPNTLGTFLSRGIIDTESATGYVFNPLVQNNATSTDSNQRTAIVEGAEMRITLQEGLLEPSAELDAFTSFTARFSGSVQADGGFTSFSFVAIPKDLLALISPRIESGVLTEVKFDTTIFADLGGGSVETNKFSYWVDVCKGCMKVDLGLCTSLDSGAEPSPGGSCNPLQDTVLECCTDSTGAEVCPGIPEDPPTAN